MSVDRARRARIIGLAAGASVGVVLVGVILGWGPGAATTGAPPGSAVVPSVLPTPSARVVLTAADLNAPVAAYRQYVRGQLALLGTQVAALQQALTAGDAAVAEERWLTAHATYHRIGAAYGALGADGEAIDGLPSGLPGGVDDPAFTGFHRIEHRLWRGDLAGAAASTAALARVVARVAAPTTPLRFEPGTLPLRAHEILEGTQKVQLTGEDDLGSRSSLLTAAADLEGTRTVIAILTPLLERRAPGLAARATAELDAAQRAIEATRTTATRTTAGSRASGWTAPADLPLARRQEVNGRIAQVLETLAAVPAALELSDDD